MDARPISLRNLGETRIQKLIVPFFQRHYIWGKENWEELFQSLTSHETKPFLGSIILKEMAKGSSVAEMNIIDGQQRLTTISILAKAIYDSLSIEKKKDSDCGIRGNVRSILFYQENAADDFKDSHIKIEHSRADAKDYVKIIEAEMLTSEEINLQSINDKSSLILQCYKYFREKLQGKTDFELTALYNNIFDGHRMVLVLIELKYDDINEQSIFDTINRAGVKLSVADIIKNNLFKTCLDKAGDSQARHNEVCNKYDKVWEPQFYKNQENIKLWEQKRVLDNVERNNLEFLLYCVACIKWGDEENISSNLERVYEKRIKPYGYQELMDLLAEICEYGLIFKRFVLEFHQKLIDENVSIYFKYKDHVTRLFLILDKFNIQLFYPYVLMRLKEADQDINDEKLIEDFRVLESFIVRRKISPKVSNDFAKKCRLLLTEGTSKLIETELVPKEAKLTDEDLLKYLFSISDDATRVVLFCIELYRCRDEKKDIASLEYRYSVEHIMPQKWKKHWGKLKVISNGVYFEPETLEGIQLRDERIQALGNKTLLTSKLNSSLRNESFEYKIEGKDLRRQGYRSHTTLSITRDIVEQYDNGDKVWDEEHIEVRTQQLYHDFLNIWPSFEDKILGSEEKTEREGLSSSEEELKLDKFSEEELADPFKLLDAVREEKLDGK